MLDDENPAENQSADNSSEPTDRTQPTGAPDAPAKKAAAKRAAAKKTTAKKATTKKAASSTTKKVATKKAATKRVATADLPEATETVVTEAPEATAAIATDQPPVGAKKAVAKKAAAKRPAAKRATKKAAASPEVDLTVTATGSSEETAAATSGQVFDEMAVAPKLATTPPPATMLVFQPPDTSKAQPRRRKVAPKPDADTAPKPDADTAPKADADTAPKTADDTAPKAADDTEGEQPQRTRRQPSSRQRGPRDDQKQPDAQDSKPSQSDESRARDTDEDADSDTDGEQSGNRRRRRRGGRRRRKSGEDGSDNGSDSTDNDQVDSATAQEDQRNDSDTSEGESSSSRRRRRRRRPGDDGDNGSDDPENTVTRVRKPRAAEDEITAVTGSTRLEAKKQRRREGREAGRRRAPIASEAEFLARREAVERVMVIRQKKDLTQIAVLEDKVLVEHYVARDSQTSLIGNVYVGRVQNVLPSMEAAFIDIGKGRNAVLYAGEVNWDALGAKGGGQRKIEQVLKSGQPVLVQVSKDPIGHKGARLTSQISLPGRFLVYVPDGTTSGISRKLPDTERSRLKTLLKEIVPDSAGVIVRTAAEGASEEELTRDVERLTARWADIESKVSGGSAPQLLYGEPDLTLKVVRDLFTEDFGKLVVSGDEAWEVVDEYVKHIAPDLEERLEKYDGGQDVFAAYRIDEQIAKGLDRKVWLPSGGSLIIDRTEAMTVVDVNTGKFTGSGGNLEETVTKNNLEAAEEIVRQLRLRDIGGIIVVDFIDMVLESNRDLVLRRMVECLGRDRTRHQVAEVTSLGLVQMTRKRIGTGLLEAFSENCEHCLGRGLLVHHEPIEPKRKTEDEPRRGRRSGRGRGRDDDNGAGNGSPAVPSPRDVAAMATSDQHSKGARDETSVDVKPSEHVTAAAEAPVSVRAAYGNAVTAAAEGAAQESAVTAAAPGAVDGSAVTAAAPGTTKLTVRSRGRARREAGPAKVTQPSSDQSGPVDVPVPETAGHVEAARPDAGTSIAGEPVDRDEASIEVSGAKTEPAAPKIVSSVRRRGAARRPAGPPPGAVAANGNPASSEPVTSDGTNPVTVAKPDTTELTGDEQEAHASAHVPVKKRSRKR